MNFKLITEIYCFLFTLTTKLPTMYLISCLCLHVITIVYILDGWHHWLLHRAVAVGRGASIGRMLSLLSFQIQ
jgi:hypothetical protein